MLPYGEWEIVSFQVALGGRMTVPIVVKFILFHNNLHVVCVCVCSRACSYDLLPSTTFCLPPMFHTDSAPPTNAFIDGV